MLNETEQKTELITQLTNFVKQQTDSEQTYSDQIYVTFDDYPFSQLDTNYENKFNKIRRDLLFEKISKMQKDDIAFLLFHLVDIGRPTCEDDKYLIEYGVVCEDDYSVATDKYLATLSIDELKKSIEFVKSQIAFASDSEHKHDNKHENDDDAEQEHNDEQAHDAEQEHNDVHEHEDL